MVEVGGGAGELGASEVGGGPEVVAQKKFNSHQNMLVRNTSLNQFGQRWLISRLNI